MHFHVTFHNIIIMLHNFDSQFFFFMNNFFISHKKKVSTFFSRFKRWEILLCFLLWILINIATWYLYPRDVYIALWLLSCVVFCTWRLHISISLFQFFLFIRIDTNIKLACVCIYTCIGVETMEREMTVGINFHGKK